MKNLAVAMVLALSSLVVGCAAEPVAKEKKGESNSELQGSRKQDRPGATDDEAEEPEAGGQADNPIVDQATLPENQPENQPAAPTPAKPAPPAPAPSPAPLACDGHRATGLQVVSLDCTAGGIVAQFFWTSAQFGNQFIDTAFDGNALFNLDASRGFQGEDLQSRDVNNAALVLLPDHDYVWRINNIVTGLGNEQANWCPSAVGSFRTPKCN